MHRSGAPHVRLYHETLSGTSKDSTAPQTSSDNVGFTGLVNLHIYAPLLVNTTNTV